VTGLVIVVVLLLAAIVVLLVLLLRRRGQGAPAPAAPQDPFRDGGEDALRGDPRTLKAGDLVEIRGVTYTVRGSVLYKEQSWSWNEHLLDDSTAGPKAWLSVEEDPDLELSLWHEVPGATVRPGQPTVDFDGRRYSKDESGKAKFTASGATGLDASGTAKYVDYEARDGALLSFESYAAPGEPDKWEVGRGEMLTRGEVRVWAQGG
jgi:hypothetical protein